MLHIRFKSNIVVIILSILIFSSCKKFDEGVYLSLRSKNNRIINTWEYAYIINLNDGSKQTAGLNGWYEKFEKNGKYTKTINYIGNITEFNGNWTYDDKKTLIINYTTKDSDFHEEYTIIRLANNEMKIKSDKAEKYLRSN